MRPITVVVLALAVATTGCLSSTHAIPKRDLQSLAQKAPETRGQRVRVIQRFSSEDEPPQAQPVSGSVNVVVVQPVHIGSHPTRTAPPPRVDPPAPAPRSAPAKAAADDAYWWIIAAAAVAVGLAATEGARYDGWVEMHPMHPVHLFGPHGEYAVMPLAHIDPETAAWADKAVVRPEEGPWRRLGRAPLDRRGLTYSLILGAAKLPSSYDDQERGFLSHIQLGYFPDHHLGLLLDIGLGWRNNVMDETLFDNRWALEVQALPLSAGKIHGGGFAQVGFGGRLEDGPQRRSTSSLWGAGGLLQLELTTRLTITGRVGVTSVHGYRSSDIGLGLSIY